MSKSMRAFSGGLICAVLLFSSCKSKKQVADVTVASKQASELVEWMSETTVDFESLSAKVNADLKTSERSGSFKATLRMRRDSAIWVSVSPAMGIEVFRLLCTADSVKYIDRIKNEYFTGTYAKLNELAKSELSLHSLQALLLGNPLYFNPALKYRARTDAIGYQLATRNAQRIGRAAGLNEAVYESISSDSLAITGGFGNRATRLQDRLDDDELIARQYWLHFETGKIVQTLLTNLESEIFLLAEYSDHELINNQLLPMRVNMALGNSKEQATFKLDYSRVKLNESLSMPFSIPEKYDEVKP